MQPIRRHDYSPRLEIMPLLDVVFLLLTFFIYSFVVMIRAEALPVALSPVGGGGQPGVASIRVLTIDAQGGFAYGDQPIDGGELDALLAEFAADPLAPTLYVSLADESAADRGPAMLELLQRVNAAGLENLVFVGPRDPSGPAR